MMKTKLRRTVAGAGALALAAGLSATLGMAAAGAEPATESWSEGGTSFSRTVSNSTPAVGESFTMSTTFTRTGPTAFNDEYVYDLKDLHHSCVKFVPGSMTWNGGPLSDGILTENVPVDEADPTLGYQRTAVGLTAWKVPGGKSPRTFSVDYTVTAECPRETPLKSSMHYRGSLGSGAYADKGPDITIKADPVNPGGGSPGEDGGGTDTPGPGTPGTGSLGTGSLAPLGSLGAVFGPLGR